MKSDSENISNLETTFMFDFQKLTIYQKAKDYNKEITKLIKNSKFDRTTWILWFGLCQPFRFIYARENGLVYATYLIDENGSICATFV